jgi:hypothetical protein
MQSLPMAAILPDANDGRLRRADGRPRRIPTSIHAQADDPRTATPAAALPKPILAAI